MREQGETPKMRAMCQSKLHAFIILLIILQFGQVEKSTSECQRTHLKHSNKF